MLEKNRYLKLLSQLSIFVLISNKHIKKNNL